MMKVKRLRILGACMAAATSVSAQMTPAKIANMIGAPVCALLQAIWNLFKAFFPALFVLMLIYGAAKYTFSADDPGGRKVGKTRIIHAIIGIVMLGLIRMLIQLFGLTNPIKPSLGRDFPTIKCSHGR